MHSHAQRVSKKLCLGGGCSEGMVRSQDKGNDKGKKVTRL